MLKINAQICDLCGVCVSVCPENALELYEKYVEIDQEKCSRCRKCIQTCPVRAISLDIEED
jgi:energy-converting hydrogenase A subunit Q